MRASLSLPGRRQCRRVWLQHGRLPGGSCWQQSLQECWAGPCRGACPPASPRRSHAQGPEDKKGALRKMMSSRQWKRNGGGILCVRLPGHDASTTLTPFPRR